MIYECSACHALNSSLQASMKCRKCRLFLAEEVIAKGANDWMRMSPKDRQDLEDAYSREAAVQ